MKHLDIALDNLADTLKAARQIIFTLAGFSIAAIYLVILSGGALKQELSQLEGEASSLKDTISRGNQILGPLRVFYEGPVEADSLNFASFIYALEVTEFELGLALARVDAAGLDAKDRAFLEYEADLLKANVFELRSVVGGLITQKRTRVPFDSLATADIRDLDYHKGKDAWGLYNDFTSLRYALQTPGSYGFQTSTASITGLENRFEHYQKEAEKTRNNRTKPEKAGHTPEVTAYVAKMSSDGYRTLADISAKLATVEKKIEEKRKQSENALKLPFVDQPIDASTLGWVVPGTAIIALLFCIFYVNRARDLCSYARPLDPDATYATLNYPWVFLVERERGFWEWATAIFLTMALIFTPFWASYLFLRLVNPIGTNTWWTALIADIVLLGIIGLVGKTFLSFSWDFMDPPDRNQRDGNAKSVRA